MKIYLIVLFALSGIFSQFVQGKENTTKVTAKCFVHLYGGQQTIYYRTINEKKLVKLAKQLTNKMIATEHSDQKKKVYQVTECILQSDEFSDPWAQQVEAKTAQ